MLELKKIYFTSSQKFLRSRISSNRRFIALAFSIKEKFISFFMYFKVILYMQILFFFAKVILVNEDKKYKVKSILKNKKKWKKLYYLVRWKKFFFHKNNWIFKHYLTNTQNILKRYHKRESFITMIFKTKKSRL